MTRSTRQPSGFTLIELLVVAAVFSVAALIGVDVFLSSTRVQRETQVTQRRQADARFTLETIIREVRVSSFDYARYADLNEDGTSVPAGPVVDVIDLNASTGILALADNDGNRTVIRRQSTDPIGDPWRADGTHLEICTTNCALLSNWADLTPEGETLCNYAVLLAPATDPFTLVGHCSNDATLACTSSSICGAGNTCQDMDYPVDVQPHATITLTLAARADQCGQAGQEIYQTTVASRLYQR